MGMKKGTLRASEADQLATRVPPEVKARFTEIARRNHRSISGELRVIVERHVEHEVANDALESAA